MSSSEANFNCTIGRLNIGFRELDLKDIVRYSEKQNWCGRTFIAIQLFFSGKGIITESGVKNLLKNHPNKDQILDVYPNLETVFSISKIAAKSFATRTLKTKNKVKEEPKLKSALKKQNGDTAARGKKIRFSLPTSQTNDSSSELQDSLTKMDLPEDKKSSQEEIHSQKVLNPDDKTKPNPITTDEEDTPSNEDLNKQETKKSSTSNFEVTSSPINQNIDSSTESKSEELEQEQNEVSENEQTSNESSNNYEEKPLSNKDSSLQSDPDVDLFPETENEVSEEEQIETEENQIDTNEEELSDIECRPLSNPNVSLMEQQEQIDQNSDNEEDWQNQDLESVEEQITSLENTEKIQSQPNNNQKKLVGTLNWSSNSIQSSLPGVLWSQTLSSDTSICYFEVVRNGKRERFSTNQGFGEYEIYELNGKYEFKRIGNAKTIDMKDLFKNLSF